MQLWMCNRFYRWPFNNTGVYGDEVPPVLIPNTEVKLISADGTWLDTARESRTLPEFYSSVAQWQSIRLLTEGLLVRAQLGEVEVEGCARCIALYLKNEAPWSSGQDASLSRWNQGFDSPRSHLTKSRKYWFYSTCRDFSVLSSFFREIHSPKQGQV